MSSAQDKRSRRRNDNLGAGSFRLRDLRRGVDYGLVGAAEARQPGKVHEVTDGLFA
jgi:hypothetical protein